MKKLIRFGFENSGDWEQWYDAESGKCICADHSGQLIEILTALGYEIDFIELDEPVEEAAVGGNRQPDDLSKVMKRLDMVRSAEYYAVYNPEGHFYGHFKALKQAEAQAKKCSKHEETCEVYLHKGLNKDMLIKVYSNGKEIK
jgi:hypothetical protein